MRPQIIYPKWVNELTQAALPAAINGSAAALIEAFDWCEAPGGPKYWMTVFRALKARGAIDDVARARLRSMQEELDRARAASRPQRIETRKMERASA